MPGAKEIRTQINSIKGEVAGRLRVALDDFKKNGSW